MKRIVTLAILFFNVQTIWGQEGDSALEQVLPEVTVRSFEQNRRLRDVPAAINIIGPNALNRFGPASLVGAVNSTPGIRLEERSPGSYRFNIRGSSLRSPFGVRNVKVYYNDIPYTQPGGITYLNQLGFYNIRSLEVIKGPGSSLYGAGTGGVLLIESMGPQGGPTVEADYTHSSFKGHNAHASVLFGKEGQTNRIGFQHQQTEGYRLQSSLRRDVFSWNGRYALGNATQLKTTFLFGDLYYETPGALTAAEFKTAPQMARPGTPTQPSAIQARAAIRQQTFLAGSSLDHQFSDIFSGKLVLYGAATSLRNPNLRGYDQSNEPHYGGRVLFGLAPKVATGSLQFQLGYEGQWGNSEITNAKNLNGNPDSLRYRDDVRNRQALAFLQGIYSWNGWQVTSGASISTYTLSFQRFAPQTIGAQERKFSNEFAGRLALLRNLGKVSVYTSVSKGFSPPAINELLPTGGAINNSLTAESGINYDAGLRGALGKWSFDLNLFYFRLQNTLVQRRDSAGGDFYLNSGKTSQKGIEASVQYAVFASGRQSMNLWASLTHHAFRYKEFKPLNNDFSGNRLPGVAPNSIAAGTDIALDKFSAQITYQYTDALPLNDANSVISDVNHLLGMQVQYRMPLQHQRSLRLYAGMDNALNQRYSLGFDINAFGGRFFNAAPPRNFYVGFGLRL